MTLPYAPEEYLPSTGDVGAMFADEIATLGGTLVDVLDDGSRLFGRALLMQKDDVTPGDTIRGGVAIRVERGDVAVHAYTERQVCTNGAIAASHREQVRIARARAGTPMELVIPVHGAIRAAVRQCAESPSFGRTMEQMRQATRSDPHRAVFALFEFLHAMSLQAPPRWHDRVLLEVMQRYEAGDDRSLFGLVNAVTSTARDEESPALRWGLQELGGRLLSGATLPPRRMRTEAPLWGEAGRLVGAAAAGG